MLGLCWTPAASKGMQKMSSTIPSKPEQLLGAILVRKDIFQRFESTMNDTCLDANNLLEYLFSLYNSTACPAERENFPTPQQIFKNAKQDQNHRIPGHNKKSPVRKIYQQKHLPNHINPNFHEQYQNNSLRLESATPQYQKFSNQNETTHTHIDNNYQLKKQKIEHVPFIEQPIHFNPGVHPTKTFDTQVVFPSLNMSSNSNIKMELGSDVDYNNQSNQPQPPSPLPPFSELRRHGNPYSPGMVNMTESLAVSTALDDMRFHYSQPPATVVVTQPEVKAVVEDSPGQNQNFTPPAIVKTEPLTPGPVPVNQLPSDGSNIIITASGRRKVKRHQCFCGAWFTRADNLKRHIRKCHEEKLEKLEKLSTPPDGLESAEDNSVSENADLQAMFPEHEMNTLSDRQLEADESGFDQQLQELHHQQQQQPEHLSQADRLNQQQEQLNHPHEPQTHQEEHHQEQQQQKEHQQQQPHFLATPPEQIHVQLSQQPDTSESSTINTDMGKVDSLMNWSCFCGERFEDHRQYVEHSRIHENSS